MSNLVSGEVSLVKLAATDLGVTSLIFVAKGNVWGQILAVVFSILYAVTSWDFRYYGEMITYLGMTGPIAFMSVISWLRHPYEKEKNVVKISRLSMKQIVWMWVLAAAATAGFGVILATMEDIGYLPMILCFVTFFVNDLYGFISWKIREKKQACTI